uniref:hypothetical protein n=1 Tax=Streptomyces sp. CA-141956 TaxID=3240051 RepID=UPI003F495E6A
MPTVLDVTDQLAFEPFTDLIDAATGDTAPPGATLATESSFAHVWIVAAEIKVEDRIAKIADFRGSFTAVRDTRVDALEVYCRNCRRPYESVASVDCEALIDNRHLIGGDQGVHAKRVIPTPPPNARLIPGGTIQRRGIGAYDSRVSRPARVAACAASSSAATPRARRTLHRRSSVHRLRGHPGGFPHLGERSNAGLRPPERYCNHTCVWLSWGMAELGVGLVEEWDGVLAGLHARFASRYVRSLRTRRR